MRPRPNVAQSTLGQVVKKAVKSTKNMQHNMAKDKQRSHRECPHRLWSHHRTTTLCVCTLAQSEACRQATTEASQHSTEGSLPKTLHCKHKAEDCLCQHVFFDLNIQKVQCGEAKPDTEHWEHYFLMSVGLYRMSFFKKHLKLLLKSSTFFNIQSFC